MYENYTNPFFVVEDQLRRLAVHFNQLQPLAEAIDEPDKSNDIANKIREVAGEVHELTLLLHEAVLEQPCNALKLPTQCPELVEPPAWCSTLSAKKFPLRGAAEPDRPASAG